LERSAQEVRQIPFTELFDGLLEDFHGQREGRIHHGQLQIDCDPVRRAVKSYIAKRPAGRGLARRGSPVVTPVSPNALGLQRPPEKPEGQQ
jgi:hypothetical protein